MDSIARALVLVLAAPLVVQAQWPGLWGPSRNGAVDAPGPSRAGGLKRLWSAAHEGGYSEVAVANGLAVTMAKFGPDDFVLALDARTGEERWRARVGPTYKGHGGSDDGPIATPAIDGADVYAVGPHGDVLAIDGATGAERWRRHLVRDFGASAPGWGFGMSPLVEAQTIVLLTGGASGKGLLALNRATGDLAWSTAAGRATSYTSAVPMQIAGVRQIVAAAADAVVAVEPSTGKELWRAPGIGGPGEVSNSPILIDGDRLLLSTWEESMLIEVSRNAETFATREVWRSPRLRASNGPVVHRDGFLYGFTGSRLICLDASTAEIRWQERVGPGTLIAMRDTLAVLSDGSGELRFVRMTPERYELLDMATVLEPGVRAVTGPSYADGRLYIRNLREIVALDLR